MARRLHNRPFDRCDENEIKVARLLARLRKRWTIRHLSINRAKGLDALALIVVGVPPFASLGRGDDQCTYFMVASRAKQRLVAMEA